MPRPMSRPEPLVLPPELDPESLPRFTATGEPPLAAERAHAIPSGSGHLALSSCLRLGRDGISHLASQANFQHGRTAESG